MPLSVAFHTVELQILPEGSGCSTCLARGQTELEPFEQELMGSSVLSPVTINRCKECCTEKKYQFVFFSTAGLGNDVKTTLSLINVICRDR